MAGTISLSPEKRWSVAGWLFDWTVEFLAGRVVEPELRASLQEIVDENLGWLGLGDFGPDPEREMRALLRDEVVEAADTAFGADMAGREAALGHLRDLAAGL
ncbi:hypothetical protein ACIA5D_12440 [Actinoplanes sp. NPDC051513]|uniref:hypothetical protein n=1 Tax=Actinoplanes sp. NPDC051513 TaxID=3363908 RepID=UPI0037ACBFB2